MRVRVYCAQARVPILTMIYSYEEVTQIITQWYRSRRGATIPDAASTEPAQMALEASQEGDVLETTWNEKARGRL